MDEFFLKQLSKQSVVRILHARGIRGIVIGGIGHTTALQLDLDLSEFAVAAVSSTLQTPRLHRTEHDHFNGIQTALRRLTGLGYPKLAFLAGREQEEILNRKDIGSFLAYHPLGPPRALSLIRSVTVARIEEIPRTLRDFRPDCLILTYTPEPLPARTAWHPKGTQKPAYRLMLDRPPKLPAPPTTPQNKSDLNHQKISSASPPIHSTLQASHHLPTASLSTN